jgi:hypothetical protein
VPLEDLRLALLTSSTTTHPPHKEAGTGNGLAQARERQAQLSLGPGIREPPLEVTEDVALLHKHLLVRARFNPAG